MGRGRFRNTFAADQHFIFHRLSNFKAYAWVHEEKKFYSKYTFAGQYDVVKLLGKLFMKIFYTVMVLLKCLYVICVNI